MFYENGLRQKKLLILQLGFENFAQGILYIIVASSQASTSNRVSVFVGIVQALCFCAFQIHELKSLQVDNGSDGNNGGGTGGNLGAEGATGRAAAAGATSGRCQPIETSTTPAPAFTSMLGFPSGSSINQPFIVPIRRALATASPSSLAPRTLAAAASARLQRAVASAEAASARILRKEASAVALASLFHNRDRPLLLNTEGNNSENDCGNGKFSADCTWRCRGSWCGGLRMRGRRLTGSKGLSLDREREKERQLLESGKFYDGAVADERRPATDRQTDRQREREREREKFIDNRIDD